jgi:hypothetical protein
MYVSMYMRIYMPVYAHVCTYVRICGRTKYTRKDVEITIGGSPLIKGMCYIHLYVCVYVYAYIFFYMSK